MKPHDWFGLGLRLAGMWLATQAATYVVYFFDVHFGFSRMRGALVGPQENEPAGYLLYAALNAAMAAYFLFGANHLTALVYNVDPAEPFREHAPEHEPEVEPPHVHAIQRSADTEPRELS